MNSDTNNISPEEFEAIECYLDGTMDETELITFEEQMKSDFSLKEKVENQRILLLAIEEQSLKDKLNTFHQDTILEEDPKVIPISAKKSHQTTSKWYKKYTVAASIIVVFGLGSLWYFSSTNNTRKLYNKYFSPDPGLATVMSSNTANFDFYDAMVNYKQGQYTTAISKWETLLANQPKNDTLNYFIGVAQLANSNEKSAIPFLEKVTNISNSNFKNEAYYYLGLAYLKSDNVELAKKYLTFSTIDNSKALLSELND